MPVRQTCQPDKLLYLNTLQLSQKKKKECPVSLRAWWQLSVMQMPSCASVLTVTDTYISALYIAPCLSCCWRRWIAPIKGESVGCSDQCRQTGSKTVLVLCKRMKGSQAANSGCHFFCAVFFIQLSLRSPKRSEVWGWNGADAHDTRAGPSYPSYTEGLETSFAQLTVKVLYQYHNEKKCIIVI